MIKMGFKANAASPPLRFEKKLEACVQAFLREEYPSTKTSMINKATDHVVCKTVSKINKL